MSDCPVIRLELADGRTRCYSAHLAGDRWACPVGTVLGRDLLARRLGLGDVLVERGSGEGGEGLEAISLGLLDAEVGEGRGPRNAVAWRNRVSSAGPRRPVCCALRLVHLPKQLAGAMPGPERHLGGAC